MIEGLSFQEHVNAAIQKELEDMAAERGISVAELKAQACANLQKLRRRKGLLVVSGGKDGQ